MREFRIRDRVRCRNLFLNICPATTEGTITDITDEDTADEIEDYYTKRYLDEQRSNSDAYYFEDELEFVEWYKDFQDKIEDRLS